MRNHESDSGKSGLGRHVGQAQRAGLESKPAYQAYRPCLCMVAFRIYVKVGFWKVLPATDCRAGLAIRPLEQAGRPCLYIIMCRLIETQVSVWAAWAGHACRADL